MSWWFYEGKIVRIKQEYQRDFGYLFEEQYEKIEDAVMRDFVNQTYKSEELQDYAIPIKELQDRFISDKLREKYATSYEDGTFTYSMNYKHHGNVGRFMWAFHELLREITEEVLDGYLEDDGG